MTDKNPNRRLFLRNTGAIATGAAIAGCAADSDSTPPSDESQQENTEPSEPDGNSESNDDSEDADLDEEDLLDNEELDEELDDQPKLDHLHGITGKTYPPDIEGNLSRRFEWSAMGGEWWYELQIPKSLGEYYDSRFGQGQYDMYVSDPYGDPYITALANEFERIGEKNGLSDPEIVNLAVGFVQNMNYTPDDVSAPFDQHTYYPVETLVERGGDCEDSTILLGAILRELGYGCVLLGLFDAGHMALGVKGDSSIPGTYYEYSGNQYYYVETTGDGWEIGEMPHQYENNANAEIIEFRDSPSLVYEYESVVTDFGTLNLNTTVWNYGISSPLQTSLYAEFEDRSGQFYSEVEANLGSIQNEGQVSKQLMMDPPDDLELRLNTAVAINGELHDMNRSEWRTSPNN